MTHRTEDLPLICRRFYKVKKDLCGHYNYYDVRALLNRTNSYNDETQKYVLVSFRTTRIASSSQLPHQISLYLFSSPYCDFHNVFCMDYTFVHKVAVLHIENITNT